MSRFQNIDEIQEVLSGICLVLILESMMAIVGGIVLVKISIRLFLVVIIIACIYTIIILIYKKPIANVNREIMENNAVVTSVLKESIDGIETVKSFSGEKHSYNKLTNKTKILINNIFKNNIIDITQSGILALIEGLGAVCILWLGCILVIHGTISLGALIAFETLVFTFLNPIQNLVSIQQDIQAAYIAMDRLDDVMEIKPENLDEIQCMEDITYSKNNISMKNVSFSYGYRKLVLNKINLSIPSAQKVAIVGNSGCGKSTLLKLIATHYHPDDGQLYLDDKNINKIPLTYLRKKIAYVPQSAIVFSGSIRDNILYGVNEVDEEQLSKIVKGCQLSELIESTPFGMNMKLSENGKELSGGQRQRLIIARVLITDPDILLFDESTNHLDSNAEVKIIEFINSNFRNKTCIYVTHRVDLIKRCDNVIYLKDGKVEGHGAHSDLIKTNECYIDHMREHI